jgi:predicted RNase H-like HicB family nuclease
MKAMVIIEKASDGYFSCYMENDEFDFGLIGHGETAAGAKADLMAAYDEMIAMRKAESREVPALDFEFKYDLNSFFDYFNMLNVTKLAEKTGINPSLLRQYRSGASKASQKQYEKLEDAIHEIGRELITANF